MNVFLIITSLTILVILFWAFLSKDAPPDDQKRDVPPEKLFRQRAIDKEIEKRYPDEKEERQYSRRKNDVTTEDRIEDVSDEFILPYQVDDIISETSRFRIYRRTLLNAEIYARKNDFPTAISLYEGVNERIHDANTNFKVAANIDYLQKYEKYKDQKEKETFERQSKENKSNEIKISIDGPLSIPDRINIGLDRPAAMIPPPNEPVIDTHRIAEEITKKIFETQDIEKEKSQEKELEKHKSEIEELKSSINKLVDSKEEVQESDDESVKEQIENEEELSKLKEVVQNVNEMVTQLSVKGEKAQEELDELKSQKAIQDNGSPAEAIKQDIFNDIKKEIKEEIKEEVMMDFLPEASETDTKPTLIEAKFESSAHSLLDLKSDLESPDTIPTLTPPEPKIVDLQINEEEDDEFSTEIDGIIRRKETGKIIEEIESKKDQREDEEKEQILSTEKDGIINYQETAEVKLDSSIPPPSELKEDEDTTKVKNETEAKKIRSDEEKEEEGTDLEFELLSEYGKEQYKEEVSDEDIFKKILEEDKKKKEDSFEIIGDKKKKEEFSYDTTDDELEKKKKEEEKFYKNFLRHEKRKAKELPILKVSYDFSKLPDDLSLSKEQNIMEHSFYKYKPMLEKAGELIKRRKVRDAINYYKVVMTQNIPPEFKLMVRKNISDLTEYLEKYLTTD